jgi:hypothetical protein
MSLDRTLVEVGFTQFKEHTIFCAHCHQEAVRLETLSESGIARFDIKCPHPRTGGPVILGTWQNEHQAALEIGEFIEGQMRNQHTDSAENR